MSFVLFLFFFFFFFNDTATTEIYTLSLHDALPIYGHRLGPEGVREPDSKPVAANGDMDDLAQGLLVELQPPAAHRVVRAGRRGTGGPSRDPVGILRLGLRRGREADGRRNGEQQRRRGERCFPVTGSSHPDRHSLILVPPPVFAGGVCLTVFGMPTWGRAFWPAMTPSGVIGRAAARPAQPVKRYYGESIMKRLPSKEIERMRIGSIALPALFAAGLLFVCGAPDPVLAQTPSGPVGIFEGHGDVGTILHPGSVDYDAAAKTYTISGSGDNIWATEDDFHYVWKKVSGDFSLTADVTFIG